MDNTMILVDYDNVFVTLKNNYRDFRNPFIMYEVISKIREEYKDDNILSYKLFADFQKVQISNEGYDILKRSHVEIEHVFNGKNASDVILMINCMKYMMQYPHIDKIVLVSSDSDLVPIFHEVQLLGKKLEVLYFEVNTSQEHIEHIKEIGIANNTIENLLGIDTYKESIDVDEFFAYKTKDSTYFAELLQCVNDAIKSFYTKFLKTDAQGVIQNAGAADVSNISYYLRENAIFPEREFWKNSNTTYGNMMSLLLDKDILQSYVYKTNGKDFTTYILNEQYLIDNGISINDLIKKTSYPTQP